MSDPRLLSDEELRSIANGSPCLMATERLLAAELIAYRAAESEVPFAAFAHVMGRISNFHGYVVVPSDPAPNREECAIIKWSHEDGYRSVPWKNLVPPAPTAVEVFAEAMERQYPGSGPWPKTYAAFREFCRVWNIPADKPLGGDAE